MTGATVATTLLMAVVAAPATAGMGDGGAQPQTIVTPLAFASLYGRAKCTGSRGYDSGHFPRTFLWRPEALKISRAKAQADANFATMLRTRAAAALNRDPNPVTAKRTAPVGGTLNDYYSIGPYWWPARGKLNGLPYERRDGKINPEFRAAMFDRARLERFSTDAAELAVAWHLWGDRRHAEKAAGLLRVWLLDPATRMNPHMNFAQAVPGRSAGRAEGLIDARVMGRVIEAIGLLESAEVISQAEQAGLESWFGEFAGWMATSAIGRAERAKSNNHGLFYDSTLIHFALFARLEAVAGHIVREWPAKRLRQQVATDGSLPGEQSRTRSLHYSFFAMEAAAQTATLAECVGVDLWHAGAGDGRSLKAAFAYLAPYADNPTRWPYPEQALSSPEAQSELRKQIAKPLMLTAWGTGDASYAAFATQANAAPDALDAVTLPPLPSTTGPGR